MKTTIRISNVLQSLDYSFKLYELIKDDKSQDIINNIINLIELDLALLDMLYIQLKGEMKQPSPN